MKHALNYVLLAAVLCLWLTTSAWAGYDEGRAAHNRGDYVTALEEWLPIAKEGNAKAQLSIGFMYFHGRGVPQDYTETVKWYRLAAEQGLDDAQFQLSGMYFHGRGVPKDYVLAHMWLNLTAAQGDKGNAAYHRDGLASFMTPAEILEAQRLAHEWLEEHGE